MPAEWEPHQGTMLSWPRRNGISFPGNYDSVMPIFCQMVEALAYSEKVWINVENTAMENELKGLLPQASLSQVEFLPFPSNEPWCRDHGPLCVTHLDGAKMGIVNFGFNAWGGKYPPWENDCEIPSRVALRWGLPLFEPKMILEGGSIDVNGTGTLITTEACLLNPNRNPNLSRDEIEQKLRDYLNVAKILWLGDGIEGDDTDGHIDDIVRFVNRTTVVTMMESNAADPNHAILQANRELLATMTIEDGTPLSIVELPMPEPVVKEDQKLPASYANFYIANKVVLLPIFNDPKDQGVISTMKELFPEREIIPIVSRELVWGLGAFHCLTQQIPLVK